MPLELKIKDRVAKVEVLEQNGQQYRVVIGGKEYDLDVVQVEASVYSVLYQGQSINLELIEGKTPNLYKINTRTDHFEVEVVDPVSRYKQSKTSGNEKREQLIEAPMPGRIVKIMVKEGDEIREGETAIIVSAMKMESEYKAQVSGSVKKVFVKEGDTVEGGAALIEIKPVANDN